MNRRTFANFVMTAPWYAAPQALDRPGAIVIVGAGVIGASIAYHLAQRGAQVIILEKERPASGATGKSFAWINASFSKRPRSYYELNLLGIAGWRRLELELGGQLAVQWGGSVEWFPAGAEAAALKKSVRSHQQWGYPTHLVDEPEFGRLLPHVRPGPLGAACHSELEGTVDPLLAVSAILKKAEDLGARLQCPCRVTGLDLAGGRVRAVQTTDGRIDVATVVLAGGVDTPPLAAIAGVKVPLKNSPGVLAHTAPRSQMLVRLALAPGAHVKQHRDGRVVTGANFGGSPVTDASKDYGRKLVQRAAQFLPALDGAPVERVTVGYRVLPIDGLPILGFAARCPNLYIAAMHSGITLAPLVGQLAALEILDGAQVDLLQPYRPERFA